MGPLRKAGPGREELEGTFGEEVVRRELAEQRVCSGGQIWEWRSEKGPEVRERRGGTLGTGVQ